MKTGNMFMKMSKKRDKDRLIVVRHEKRCPRCGHDKQFLNQATESSFFGKMTCTRCKAVMER